MAQPRCLVRTQSSCWLLRASQPVFPPHSPVPLQCAPGTSAEEPSETLHPVYFYVNQRQPGRGGGGVPNPQGTEMSSSDPPPKGDAALEGQENCISAKMYFFFSPFSLCVRKLESSGPLGGAGQVLEGLKTGFGTRVDQGQPSCWLQTWRPHG